MISVRELKALLGEMEGRIPTATIKVIPFLKVCDRFSKYCCLIYLEKLKMIWLSIHVLSCNCFVTRKNLFLLRSVPSYEEFGGILRESKQELFQLNDELRHSRHSNRKKWPLFIAYCVTLTVQALPQRVTTFCFDRLEIGEFKVIIAFSLRCDVPYSVNCTGREMCCCPWYELDQSWCRSKANHLPIYYRSLGFANTVSF